MSAELLSVILVLLSALSANAAQADDNTGVHIA